MAEKVRTVFIQVIEKPARKAVIRRGVRAEDYFAYCEEVGCDVWGLLTSMRSLCGEPVRAGGGGPGGLQRSGA